MKKLPQINSPGPLPGHDADGSERQIDIDVIDALLPCRKFAISFKVAELGKLSLASEFLLRLIYSVDGIPENEASGYFGFSDSEIAFVVDDLAVLSYVERRDGALWITSAGRELFRGGSDVPELYEVERRRERHGFDLISFAPAESEGLSSFEAALPELQLSPGRASRASREIPAAFQKHFDSLVRRVSETPLRQSLYAVDAVTPLSRFAVPVRIAVRAQAALPGLVEPDVSSRWSGYELDDRTDVVDAAAMLLRASRVGAGSFDDLAFDRLVRVAPETITEFSKGGIVRRDLLYREALRRAGDLRSDRQTALFCGSLFTDRNLARLNRALDYAGQRDSLKAASVWFWHAPAVPFWGATRRLPQVIELVSDGMPGNGTTRPIDAIGIVHDRPQRYLERAFDNCLASRSREMRLGPVEILLIPHRVAAVVVHAPGSGSTEGYPLPLGILSFDEDVVRRATGLLRELVFPLSVLQTTMDNDVLGPLVDDGLLI